MKLINNSMLVLLFFVLGPMTAMVGHIHECGLFEMESTVLTCSNGKALPDYWLWFAMAMPCLPALVIFRRLYVLRPNKYLKFSLNE